MTGRGNHDTRALLDSRLSLADALAGIIEQAVRTAISEAAPAKEGAPLLHTPERAAELLSVSRATVYGLLRRGDLGSIVVGDRSRRIPHEALVAYVRAQADGNG
jgi:excisionase family DNA binding protein